MIALLLLTLLIMAAMGNTKGRQHTGIAACLIIAALAMLLAR